MLGTSEGSFAVDDPVMAKQLPEPGGEELGLGEELEVAMEAEFALGESVPQRGHEVAAKHPAQHFVGKKKGAAGLAPARGFGSRPTAWEAEMDTDTTWQLPRP